MEALFLVAAAAAAYLYVWRWLRRHPLTQCPRCKGKPIKWERILFLKRGRVCSRCGGTGLKSGSKR